MRGGYRYRDHSRHPHLAPWCRAAVAPMAPLGSPCLCLLHAMQTPFGNREGYCDEATTWAKSEDKA